MELSALAPMLQFLSLHLKIKRTGALSRPSLIMLMRDLAFGNVDKSELSRVFRTWYNTSSGYSSTPGLLDYCLARMSGAQCMDPRDQIFACLGIVKKAAANLKELRLE